MQALLYGSSHRERSSAILHAQARSLSRPSQLGPAGSSAGHADRRSPDAASAQQMRRSSASPTTLTAVSGSSHGAHRLSLQSAATAGSGDTQSGAEGAGASQIPYHHIMSAPVVAQSARPPPRAPGSYRTATVLGSSATGTATIGATAAVQTISRQRVRVGTASCSNTHSTFTYEAAAYSAVPWDWA